VKLALGIISFYRIANSKIIKHLIFALRRQLTVSLAFLIPLDGLTVCQRTHMSLYNFIVHGSLILQIKWPWSKKMGDLSHDTMAAIELVSQLQKIRDLDPRDRFQGDTDGSSIYSLSTVDQSQTCSTTEVESEIARPRVRRPKRTAHLSLDRVFRKRFHKLKKELEVG